MIDVSTPHPPSTRHKVTTQLSLTVSTVVHTHPGSREETRHEIAAKTDYGFRRMGDGGPERDASPWCRAAFGVGLRVGLSASSVDRRATVRAPRWVSR